MARLHGRDHAAAPADPERIALRRKNSQVWDMVLNLLHPPALYVLLQLLLWSHLGRSPALSELGPLHPVSLGVCLLQFLGAWSVFYTVLLRDMGHASPEGTALLVVALLGTVSQYLLFPSPRAAGAAAVWGFLGPQLALAGLMWPLTLRRWRRLKARAGDEPAQGATS